MGKFNEADFIAEWRDRGELIRAERTRVAIADRQIATTSTTAAETKRLIKGSLSHHGMLLF